MSKRFMRQPKVLDGCGLSKSRLYEFVAAGVFPKPVKIGTRAVAWIEEEIAAWKEARIAERDANLNAGK